MHGAAIKGGSQCDIVEKMALNPNCYIVDTSLHTGHYNIVAIVNLMIHYDIMNKHLRFHNRRHISKTSFFLFVLTKQVDAQRQW